MISKKDIQGTEKPAWDSEAGMIANSGWQPESMAAFIHRLVVHSAISCFL